MTCPANMTYFHSPQRFYIKSSGKKIFFPPVKSRRTRLVVSHSFISSFVLMRVPSDG